jgi:hypothetical protein
MPTTDAIEGSVRRHDQKGSFVGFRVLEELEVGVRG